MTKLTLSQLSSLLFRACDDLRGNMDAGGSTIKHIYITVIDKMLVALPKRAEELEAMSQIVEQSTAMIEIEHLNLAKLRQQKQGLMHDLLTGRVPVTSRKESPHEF